MKKKLMKAAALLVCMTFALCGCGKKKDVIKVGMEIGYPPFEYYDEDGSTPIGIDIELGRAIADEMGVDIEFINTAWDGIFEGLDNDEYDCIISGVTITPERVKDYDFTQPYIQNYQSLVVLKDSEVKPKELSECAGLRVGFQEETMSDSLFTEYMSENNMQAETYEYAKIIDSFSDLKLGRIDVIVCDSTVSDVYAGAEDSIYEITWVQNDQPEEFGICVKKGNRELLDKLDSAISTLKQNGKLDEILSNNL